MKKNAIGTDPQDIFKIEKLKVSDADIKKHWDKVFSAIAINKPKVKAGNQ
ncbi:hypothetical protein KXQ82_08475 [Mucilaginibacter sp. HMF5004]|nr:hypothetical protein [Mucilaginibacter rivuli]MBW4889749.1 hypothetical protein [Mucilaginibacter rivuli]